MDGIVVGIFNMIGIKCDTLKNLDGQMFPREIFLNMEKYEEIQIKLNELKKYLSSSSLTSLQNTAGLMQKWPLINLVRQLLKTYQYSMEPVRKSDGYDADGKKKYKRYFKIKYDQV
jgi:hypothetical protein